MIIWKIDNAHTTIGFRVKHLMISNVRGNFKNFDGTIEMASEDFIDAKINFSAETESIDTKNEMRDGHLKSADFFDAAQFPTLSFTSKSITKNPDSSFTVKGDMNMHGITKEIELKTILNGSTIDLYGSNVMSFEITGTLSRQDFGLTWNAPIETGGVAVSDEVKLEIDAEFKEVK